MKNQVLPEKSEIKKEVIPLVLSMWRVNILIEKLFSDEENDNFLM